MFHFNTLAGFIFAAILSTAVASTCQQAAKIGSDHGIEVAASSHQPFSQIISHTGATYIAPHFAFLDLAPGAVLEISALDGSQKVRYTTSRSDFYAQYVAGSAAVLTYFPPTSNSILNDIDSVAFKVDRYASGFPTGIQDSVESICGRDDSQPLVCIRDSDPIKYQKAQAVARLFISGSGLCTGWLLGSEGHLITNNHCIGGSAAAKNTQFEFGAECSSCTSPNNTKAFGCKGAIVATTSQFIYTNKTTDFTLVKLNVTPGVDITKYGYLQVRESGPVLNEPIYIAQHPGGKPKRIATVVDDGSVGTIEKFSIASCSPDEIGYSLDTEGGSSGSPVLSASENVVVGLHNCGGCQNGAIKINKVVAELKRLGFLPANAIADGSPHDYRDPCNDHCHPAPTTAIATPAPTTRAPTTATPTTPRPTTPRPVGCGSCKFCFFVNETFCLSAFNKDECFAKNATYATLWCGK